MERKLAAIFSADVQGYSRLMGDDERATVQTLTEYRGVMTSCIQQHRGRVVDSPGDNILADFASVVDAVQCGVAIQQELEVRNAALPEHRKMLFRIGINLGDVLVEGERIYGDGVNIAARMEGLAAGGGMCISGTAYDQVENKLNLEYVALGEQVVKNIVRPVRVYQVVLETAARDEAQTAQISVQAERRTAMKVSSVKDAAQGEHLSVGRRHMAGLLVGVVGVLLGIIGVIAWQGRRWLGPDTVAEIKAESTRGSQEGMAVDSPATKEVPSLDKRRIAVLPFVNLSADPDNEYFSDGMTEELISRLSQIRGLEVIARTSAMKYKGVAKDVAEIGRELQIGTVLEGSVRKAENQVRVTVQLINVHNQMHLWSQDYDRELKGVFAIQSDIAQRVTEALKGQLLSAEKQQIAKQGTENLEAYNLALKGRYYFKKLTKAGLQKATEYFEQAIAQDPGYAQAYADLAWTYAFFGWWAYFPPKEVCPKARALAEKAVEMDTQLADGYLALALVKMLYDWDWGGAEKDFQRAFEVDSSAATRPRYGIYAYYLMFRGRYAEAIAVSEKALQLDPLNIALNTSVGVMFVAARQYDRAIEQYRKILDLDPHNFYAHYRFAWAYLGKEMYEETIAEFHKALALAGDNAWIIAGLGHAYAVSGKRDQAVQLLAILTERSKQEYVQPGAFAFLYIGLGENDLAFEQLQKDYEGHADDALLWLKACPGWDRLSADPRWAALLQKVGLE
jgi:TolB-like protein/class 3 adenylate cyclase/Flp pilus assembly protein TadD